MPPPEPLPFGITVSTADALVPFSDPVSITGVVTAVFAAVEMANVAVCAPGNTVTDAGAVAAGLLAESATTVAATAVPPSVTVPVATAPAVTETGETARPVTVALGCGMMVSVAAALVPFRFATIITVVDRPTVEAVATPNVAVWAPGATVTEAGTLALALFVVNVTTVGEVATPPSVTVAVVLLPANTEVGARLRAVSWVFGAGSTVRIALPLEPFSAAVIVAVFAAVSPDSVATPNDAVCEPAKTVTWPGTLQSTGSPFVSETRVDVVAAAPRVTVPVDVFPLMTVAGARLMPVSCVLRAGRMVRVVSTLAPFRVAVIVAVFVTLSVESVGTM